MNHQQMITNAINIKIADRVEDAPNYSDEFKLVKIDSAIVVCRGTTEGNPTVDLQLTDADGKKYLVMATGGIIEALGSTVHAKRVQTNSN